MKQLNLTRRRLLSLFAVSGLVGTSCASIRPRRYVLQTAEGRSIEVSHWSGAAGVRKQAVILFSHGAASAPWKYDPLLAPWIAAGFDVYAPLHVDSVDHPETDRFPGLASWQARLEDMHVLAASFGTTPRIAAGHSYGGLVALTLGGAAAIPPEGFPRPMRDSGTVAAVAFSPPGPRPVLVEAEGFASLDVPAFIQTGTRDVPPGADKAGWRQHLEAYEFAKAGGDRYALVLDAVDHYFGGVICSEDVPGPPQNDQLKVAADLATLFIRAFSNDDANARRELDARLAADGPTQLVRK